MRHLKNRLTSFRDQIMWMCCRRNARKPHRGGARHSNKLLDTPDPRNTNKSMTQLSFADNGSLSPKRQMGSQMPVVSRAPEESEGFDFGNHRSTHTPSERGFKSSLTSLPSFYRNTTTTVTPQQALQSNAYELDRCEGSVIHPIHNSDQHESSRTTSHQL